MNDKLSVTHVFSCYVSIFLLIKRLLPVIGRDGRDGREGREGPPGPPENRALLVCLFSLGIIPTGFMLFLLSYINP